MTLDLNIQKHDLQEKFPYIPNLLIPSKIFIFNEE